MAVFVNIHVINAAVLCIGPLLYICKKNLIRAVRSFIKQFKFIFKEYVLLSFNNSYSLNVIRELTVKQLSSLPTSKRLYLSISLTVCKFMSHRA